jgi:outer membrane protein assembly factor BamB
MLKRACVVLVSVTLLTLTLHSAANEQWPKFRGTLQGVAEDDPALPDTWSETENVAWKVTIPGLGWSSPIVWNDHIIVTSAIAAGEEKAPVTGLYDEQGGVKSTNEHRWVVYDVEFGTGKIRWETEIGKLVPPYPKHLKNTFASETAVTDGERVYVWMGTIGFVGALDINDGKVLWHKDVGMHPTTRIGSEYGFAASPVLHKDRLYIVSDNLKQSFIAAFDAKTGTEIWRTNREETGNWSTPVVWENERRTEIIVEGGQKNRSYSIEDGKLLWEYKGNGLTSPTPLIKNGMIYLNAGYPGNVPRPVIAIRPGATGDITLKDGTTTNDYVVWYQPVLGTYNTSALIYGDYYYTLLDRGFLLAHDAKTGKEVYARKRLSVEASGFTSSPWAYNGKIFLLSEDGDTFVVQAGPEYKMLGKNSLNEFSMATPAVARGSLIIRTASKLYRIAKRQS